MANSESLWKRLRVESAGLSIETYVPWPVEPIVEADAGGIYQPIPDTSGLVFVRCGPRETLEAFGATLGDLMTQAHIQSEQAIDYCGQNARRVTWLSVRPSLGIYREDTHEGLTHEIAPETQKLSTAIGFQYKGVPVLVGYELPAESLVSYELILDRILNSAAPL